VAKDIFDAKKQTTKTPQKRSGEGQLPLDLENLTQDCMEKFTIIVDEDGKNPIATSVVGNDGKKYDLKKDLRLAQLRKLAKCVGVKGHNSLSKAMVCR
jgi:hypothetical protein